MKESDIPAAIAEALACVNAGRLERAERIYREIVAQSSRASHHADLGVICGMRGKHEDAVLFLKQAVDLEPGTAEFHFKLARACKRRGILDDARRGWQKTVELAPGHADALSELGCLHLERNETEQGIEHFRRAVAANSRHYHAWNNLGIAYRRHGKMAEAIECHERAIALQPGEATAYDSLGMAYFAMNRQDDAIRCHRKAVALNPKAPIPYCNLGNAYVMSLRVEEAIASLEQAIALDPGAGTFHWNYSNALLLAGRYEQGWQEYEWRWRAPELGKRKPAFDRPEWRGEELAGRTILLYGEQGYGDVIQFARYAALIARRGGKVLMAAEPPLLRLMAGAAGVSGVIAPGSALPGFDFHYPLLSLPAAFKTTLAAIPSDVPYLRCDPQLAAAWRARLPGAAALKVGLIWAGRQNPPFGHLRSCPLAEFAALSRAGGARFYSLQSGEPGAQAQSQAAIQLVDLTGEIEDFADTAALMENLDLVVSIDTAGAHLAGALGKPVWLLNRYQTDWRWLQEREDSPWYPTMRIFRQSTIGDWTSVMERVAAELEKFAASRDSVRSDPSLFSPLSSRL